MRCCCVMLRTILASSTSTACHLGQATAAFSTLNVPNCSCLSLCTKKGASQAKLTFQQSSIHLNTRLRCSSISCLALVHGCLSVFLYEVVLQSQVEGGETRTHSGHRRRPPPRTKEGGPLQQQRPPQSARRAALSASAIGSQLRARVVQMLARRPFNPLLAGQGRQAEPFDNECNEEINASYSQL